MVISKNCLYFQNNKRYDILTVLSNRYPATGGGEHMEIVISFLPTGIIAYADHEINMQQHLLFVVLIFTNVEQLVKGYLQIRKHNQM